MRADNMGTNDTFVTAVVDGGAMMPKTTCLSSCLVCM